MVMEEKKEEEEEEEWRRNDVASRGLLFDLGGDRTDWK